MNDVPGWPSLTDSDVKRNVDMIGKAGCVCAKWTIAAQRFGEVNRMWCASYSCCPWLPVIAFASRSNRRNAS